MQIIAIPAQKTDMSLDFKPRKPWSPELPAVVVHQEDRFPVLAGFERIRGISRETSIEVLALPPSEVPYRERLETLHGSEAEMANLERLRFKNTFGEKLSDEVKPLLSLPLEFQDWLDDKDLSLRSLQPLAHLRSHWNELLSLFTALSLSNAQTRDGIDLLCDLTGMGKSFADLTPLAGETGESWIRRLLGMRMPQALSRDHTVQKKLGKIAWPKDVQARWERWGDQSGLSLKLQVQSPEKWVSSIKKLRELEGSAEFAKLWMHDDGI